MHDYLINLDFNTREREREREREVIAAAIT